MALLKMDDMMPHLERNSIISIPSYRTNEAANYACYKIQINLDSYTWTVERRYSEFVAFDVKRFPDRKKSFLPPKKYVRNMDPEFLTERRLELEKYIRTVMELELWLQKKNLNSQLPKLLARFLDFHQYVSSFTLTLSIHLFMEYEMLIKELKLIE
ncbi:hypothetical protein QR680_002990 [Steinernema hermaphroditum]|uniref:PX domain-containing protein n=1 Tax=Steinernema hermaphroditum TaxID=289476 RepID=A0AA39LJG5_9BILA|nr:hypothetical protein QR680_002990 [Steinernema hermaphroditum]